MASQTPKAGKGADERRGGARHPVEVAVEISHGTQMHIHATGNLSGGGAFFHRAIPYAVGTQVQLKIHIPGEPQPVECDGEVVNVPNKKELGMGVRFQGLTAKDAQRLDTFAKAHAKNPR
jgi:uncharacterized protein (TIGR02266 family)